MAGEGDDTKVSSVERDDTLLAASAPERSSVPTIAPPPDQRYLLGVELGRGGMGRVVEAFDTHLGRTVAFKEVLPKAGNIERRFQREVRITARLEHASIVPVYDSGRLADGRAFYVMRRVTGKPLDEAIARARTLEGRLALLPNALAAIDAVAHAHKRGVIHRDLKPQNILVGELGETVVIDWGLAKVIGDEDEPVHDSLEPRVPSAADSLQTQVGSVFGTPGFMPPEQARGDELGPSTDVYALGATLYQVIAGKPPFGGTSATDVISSTLRHRYEPISRVCPGTPPEMVTIIEKALAFEQTDRYPNAGALAEDVRRFLTGQLVAAHRYTKRERVARFTRKHRAPLIVAALASVGIAVLAWVSVHRILVERDTAAAASIEAKQQRERADARAAEIRERADQLLLLHARGLLDTDPTQALAVIKQVEGSGGLIREEAKALAKAAVMRGVAWGLPTLPEHTTSLEMSRDGKRVLQMNRFGLMQVIDVDTKRQVATYKGTYGGSAEWVDHDRQIFVTVADDPPVLFDPATGTVARLDIGRLRQVSVNGDASKIAAIEMATKRIVLIDPATRAITFVPGHIANDSLAYADDGSWLAFSKKDDTTKTERLIVIDPSGRLLAQRDGHVTALEASPTGKLAVAFWDDGVFEVSSMANPVFTPVPITGGERAHQLLYRNDRLHFVTQAALYVWTGKIVARLRTLEGGAMIMRSVGDGVLAITSIEGRVHLYDNEVTHTLNVTTRPPLLRIAGVPGSSKLVATAQDALLVFDLDQVIPRKLPRMSSPMFTSESRIVSPPGMDPEWVWLDPSSGKTTSAALTVQPSLIRNQDATRDDGRAMVLLSRRDDRSTCVIGYPSGKQIVIEDIAFGLCRLVEGEGIAYSTGKGRLFGKIGDAEAHELATLDGDILSIADLGKLTYAALSKNGELVRGRFDGAQFTRAHLPDVETSSFLDGEPGGAVLIASGIRLLRWSNAIEEIAHFSAKISWMQATPNGTVVGLANKETLFMPASGDRTPHRMPIGDHMYLADEGVRAVSFNSRNELEVLELPSMITWTLPRLYSPMPFLAMAPSGRRIYHVIGHDAVLVTLPEPGSDFAAWLDEQTNGTEADRHVQWPWQTSVP